MVDVTGWPPAAVATAAAAVLALSGSVAGMVWAGVRWRRDADRIHRDGRWARAVWIAEMACSSDVGRVEVGRKVADAMYDIRIPRRLQDPMVKVVVDMFATQERNDDAVRHQRGRGRRGSRVDG